MDMKPDDMIMIIKERIKDEESIPVLSQRLMYKGNDLRNDKTLAFHEIQDNATIHLVRIFTEYTDTKEDVNT